MIPIGGGNGGWSGCAPNPGGAATNSQDLVDQLKVPQKKDFDNYHAVAYHPDASDIWIMGGATRRDAAERDARLLCGINMLLKGGANEASAEACTVAFSGLNNVSSFARGMDGDFYYASGSTLDQSDAAMLDKCRTHKDICVVFRQWVAHPTLAYAPTQESHQPEGYFRKIYASAAWMRGQAAQSRSANAVHVVGAQPSKAAAERAALEACQQQSGQPCATARTVADTFLVLMKRSDHQVSITSSPTVEMAPGVAQAVCGEGVTCTVTAVVSASTEGVRRFSPLTGEESRALSAKSGCGAHSARGSSYQFCS